MQAVGPGLPLLSHSSGTTERAQGYPAQDLFQSLLQGRMVAQKWKGTTSTALSQAKAELSSKYRLDQRGRLESPLAGQSKAKSLKPASRDLKDSAHVTGMQGDAQPWLQKASGKTGATGSKGSKGARSADRSSRAKASQSREMSPHLSALVDLLNQQPGGALKVPADRLPEVQNFLLKAGLPTDQVELLMSSPRFQELGLTADDVQAAWQRTVQNAQAADDQTAALTETGLLQQAPPASQITGQSGYQQMWQSLRFPSSSLPQLRLALQRLGVSPEALSGLGNVGAGSEAGIPLSQVWSLMEQAAANSGQTGASGQTPSAPVQAGWQDQEEWRQLLVQAGMDRNLAETLVGKVTSTSGDQVRQTLLDLAPTASSTGPAIPQPLYLPTSMRLGPALPQQILSNFLAGGDKGKLAQDAALSARTQDLNAAVTAGLDLKKNLPPAADLPAAVSAQGSPSGPAPIYSDLPEAVWSQIQSAIPANLPPGESQVTVNLQPPDLGAVQLTLNRTGNQVEITAVAANPEVAQAVAGEAPQLSQTLARQGMVLTQFQAQVQDNSGGRATLAAGDKESAPLAKAAGESRDPVFWAGETLRQVLPSESPGAFGEGGDLMQEFGFGPQARNPNTPASGSAANPDFKNLFSSSPDMASLLAGKDASGNTLTGTSGGAASASTLAPMSPEMRQVLWSQVQDGVLANATPGESRVTLSLRPAELGSLQLTLNLKGQHLEVTAVADRPEVAQVAQAQVQQLVQSLAQQGLTLTQFQVQYQDSSGGQNSLAFGDQGGGQRQSGKKDSQQSADSGTPQRRRTSGGFDFFV